MTANQLTRAIAQETEKNVAKLQKNVDGGLLSHEDERQKIIQVVKAENESQKRFADADTLFGTKRWEDDWLRIYKYAATGGYLGNLISVILGFSGGIFLCYQLTSNWAAAIATGGIIVLIMEVTKSVSLREATIHNNDTLTNKKAAPLLA